MIGKMIAEIRKQRGYTLSELAELSHISKSYLSNIERNLNKNPSIEIIKRIAKVLDIDPIILLKVGSEKDTQFYVDKEWADFVSQLKDLGVEKEELSQYKTLIEFIKWKNQTH
ncbi:helix-turn-helix transcriptional regulator [Bacillus sp. BRMEA1]|uniref:helix-turn-helix domain-containing protein n=1 Tax=Neobacillus endophyticus TaxID=2738405 RepID=UPI00156308F8|nr:helix-turn-helix transcriptional regulator [Neobacillus endophyticus]NRD76341.1 helix-turn-helix transcriptional regulator [Neobacillus endophyticus]